MKYLVSALVGKRVGIFQDEGWLLITSACCEARLVSNDDSDNDLDYYRCTACNRAGARRDDYSGEALGTRIATSTNNDRITEWVSCWLEAPCVVKIER